MTTKLEIQTIAQFFTTYNLFFKYNSIYIYTIANKLHNFYKLTLISTAYSTL